MEPIPRSRGRRAVDFITVGVFALVIGLPVFGLFFRTPPKLEENRARYTFPPISAERYVLQDFPRHFEMYLGDHIGYRDVLLAWHRRAVYGLLDEPVTAQAWIGSDGWFYLNQSDPYRGNPKKPSANARTDLWVEALAERDAWFRAQGIEYIVLLAPDKAAVYPEHLRGYPQRHPPLELATPVAEKLKARGVTCVNLLPAIRAEKARHPELLYYFKTDSHWTPDGGRAAYHSAADAVRERFPDFRAHPDRDYTFGTNPGGDLRALAGIRDDVPMEFARTYVPLTPIDYRATHGYFSPAQKAEQLDKNPIPISTSPSATGPKMLFLHDSFGAFLWPFVASDFRQASSIGTYGVPLEAVRIEKPRLVIQLLVARQLYCFIPSNPPEIAKGSR